MARNTRMTKQQKDVMQLLRLGGAKIPAGFAGRVTAATKAILSEGSNSRNAMLEQGARLFSRLKGGSTVAVDDPANKKTLDGLLRWHKERAGRKLPFPKVPPGIGGFFPGSISGTVVPPFDFADSIPTLLANVSNPTLSVSASVNGQISGSAVSSQTRGFNGGSEYREGRHLLSPDDGWYADDFRQSDVSFEWSTNSLNTSLVTSSGSVGLTIYGMNEWAEISATAGGLYESWNEIATGEIHLDFGFNVQKSLSASLSVAPSLVYLCFVEIEAHVVGMGWPGSLATAMASATVPSISYRFDPQPLVMA